MQVHAFAVVDAARRGQRSVSVAQSPRLRRGTAREAADLLGGRARVRDTGGIS